MAIGPVTRDSALPVPRLPADAELRRAETAWNELASGSGDAVVPAEVRQDLVPAQWQKMGFGFAAGVLYTAFASGSAPGISSAILLLLAAVWPLCARWTGGLEDRFRQNAAARYGLLLVIVGLPMTAFGAGLARWTGEADGLAWSTTVGVLVVVRLIADSVLHPRLPSSLLATLSIWLGVVIQIGSFQHIAIFIAGAVIAFRLARRQLRYEQLEAMERHRH